MRERQAAYSVLWKVAFGQLPVLAVMACMVAFLVHFVDTYRAAPQGSDLILHATLTPLMRALYGVNDDDVNTTGKERSCAY